MPSIVEIPGLLAAITLGSVVCVHAADASKAKAPANSTSGGSETMNVKWELVTEHAAFSPRDTAEDALFLDKMWLSNGYYHGNVLHRDLYNSTDGVTWKQVSDATPYHGYAELAVFKSKLWAIKGDIWNSADGVTWTKILDKAPFGARGYGELVVFQDKMWQIGSADDVWNTADGVAWTCVAKALPYGKRFAAAVAVYDNRLWLMGGALKGPSNPPEKGYKDTTTYNDVWSSRDGIEWTRVIEHAPWSPRQWFTVRAYADKLWLIGGYDNVNGANLGDVWVTTDGALWTPVTCEKPSFTGRHEPTCYVYKGSLWIVAGNSWPVRDDVWRLTLPEGKEN